MKLNKDNELHFGFLLWRDRSILPQQSTQLLVIHKGLSKMSRNDVIETVSASMDALAILALGR